MQKFKHKIFAVFLQTDSIEKQFFALRIFADDHSKNRFAIHCPDQRINFIFKIFTHGERQVDFKRIPFERNTLRQSADNATQQKYRKEKLFFHHGFNSLLC